METINNWKQLTFDSLTAMGQKIMGTLPDIFGAIMILLIGWIITKIVIYILGKVLKVIKIDKLTSKINDLDLFGENDIKFKVSKVILVFVKWLLLLVFLIIAADIMEWNIVSVEIGNLLRYLPKLFSAMALFMIGMYIANFVEKAINGFYESFDLGGAKIISKVVFYIIAVIISVTALNQAGIDTSIITNNITIILGAFLLAISIGFGLGSKEIIGDLLRSFYSRKNYELGDKIKFNEVEGTVESIDNICMTIKTNTGKIIIPIKDLVEATVEVNE